MLCARAAVYYSRKSYIEEETLHGVTHARQQARLNRFEWGYMSSLAERDAMEEVCLNRASLPFLSVFLFAHTSRTSPATVVYSPTRRLPFARDATLRAGKANSRRVRASAAWLS